MQTPQRVEQHDDAVRRSCATPTSAPRSARSTASATACTRRSTACTSARSTRARRGGNAQQRRIASSADYLGEHMGEAPVLVIAVHAGPRRRRARDRWPRRRMGNVLPAMWSFMLAARARGLGTCWTTLHLMQEQAVADIARHPVRERAAGVPEPAGLHGRHRLQAGRAARPGHDHPLGHVVVAVDAGRLRAARWRRRGSCRPTRATRCTPPRSTRPRRCRALPLLEVGSYCGRRRSGSAPRRARPARSSFAVDHHRGSEENQAGWEHHDPTSSMPAPGGWTRCRRSARTIDDAGLEDVVVARRRALGRSSPPTGARRWRCCSSTAATACEPARADYDGWTPHVAPGGTLAIHDVFPDPADGGRPPYEEIYLPALASGRFVELRRARQPAHPHPRTLTIDAEPDAAAAAAGPGGRSTAGRAARAARQRSTTSGTKRPAAKDPLGADVDVEAVARAPGRSSSPRSSSWSS